MLSFYLCFLIKGRKNRASKKKGKERDSFFLPPGKKKGEKKEMSVSPRILNL